MIDDDIFMVIDRQRITLHLVLVSHTKTEKADDDIVRLDDYRISGYTDTVSGSCLTGDSEVSSGYLQLAFEVNRPCYIEYNRSCPVHLYGLTQCALSRLSRRFVPFVFQCSDMNDDTSAASGGQTTPSLRTRKSQCRLDGFRFIPSSASQQTERQSQPYGIFNTHSHSKAYHSKPPH